MTVFKTYVIKRFETLIMLAIATAISIFLLMVRMKLTHSFFFIFLVWNLFLASVPFYISEYLYTQRKIKTFKFAIWGFVWLLFLPNAPYLVTDFIHLQLSVPNSIGLDILMVSAFALSGLLFFCFSLKTMLTVLRRYLNPKFFTLIKIALFCLTGFGVYLGRFLRYNSWEIIQNPITLLVDVFNIALYPHHHINAWLFTIGFALFLMVSYLAFQKLLTKLSYRNEG